MQLGIWKDYQNVICVPVHYIVLNISLQTNTDEPYGTLRLVRRSITDSTFTSGRLEIFINGEWGTICDDSFDRVDADVACQELGFSTSVSYRPAVSTGYDK